MIIVARTNNGFLCEVRNSEIESILSKNDERKGKVKDLSIGTDLSFTSALERLTILKDVKLNGSYKSLEHLDKAKEELERVISIVKSVEDPLIKVQEKIKESGIV